MAVYTAYYDASGSEADPSGAITTAGLVATANKWNKFERAWKAVLSEFGVPYFHAQDFVGQRGPFLQWGSDEFKRGKFFEALVKVLKRGINKGFTVTVDSRDFKFADQFYGLREACGPYTFSAGACIRRSEEWIMRQHPEGMPLHVIERGDEGQLVLCRMLKAERAAVTVRPKRDAVSGEWLPQFQAADLVGWEYRRGYLDVRVRGRRGDDLRQSFGALVSQVPHEAYELHREELMEMCKEDPESFPAR
jgi:hypothetical protein